MVNVSPRRCSYPSSCKLPKFGSKRRAEAKFCPTHSTEMVEVEPLIAINPSRVCGHLGCRIHRNVGVEGRKTAIFCAAHAMEVMVNVVSRNCAYPACLNHPGYGVDGSNRLEFCSPHATAGMVNAESKKCSADGCSTRASYGAPGSKKAKFRDLQANDRMMGVNSKKCAHPGCRKT